MRRFLLAALSVAAVLSGSLVLAGGPASASSSNGYCPTAKGVTVVVDFRALGGDVQVRCFSSAISSSNGLDALKGAGFEPEGTQTDGPAFVCRINNQPTTKKEACIHTPPASAYWSYWHAPNGGSWSYSTLGATHRQVILGGFEGWSFYKGSGGADSVPAPGARPTRPPAPTVSPSVGLGQAASTKGPGSSPSTSSTATPSKATTKPATPTTTSTAGATPLDGSTAADANAGGSVGALPADDPSGGHSPWPFVLAAIGILLVLTGAGVVVRRRRGTSGL